jgi:hypothetical protein
MNELIITEDDIILLTDTSPISGIEKPLSLFTIPTATSLKPSPNISPKKRTKRKGMTNKPTIIYFFLSKNNFTNSISAPLSIMFNQLE